ncbi:MAG: hypothetical protein K2K70_10200, partial [Lachnospiraceae bacterium]|nr:hypothetical protein [Lachnospiraceae bacterium]
NAEKAAKKINKMVEASDQLSSMKTGIGAISDVLAETKENLKHKKTKEVGIGADTLAGFDADIKGLDSWEEFEETLGNGKSEMEDCQKAANKLATEWVNSNNFLSQLNGTNEDYYISTLKEMGVENAEAVVTAALSKKEAELNAEKKWTEATTKDLADATADEIDKLAKEKGWTDDTKNALYEMALEKQAVNGLSLDFSSDIDALIKFGEKLGYSTNALKRYKDALGGKNGSAGMPSNVVDYYRDGADEERNDIIDGKNKKDKVKIDVTPDPTTSDSRNRTKNDSKKKKTALEKFQEWISKLFDWIEIKIQRQTEKIDKYVSKAENAKDEGKYTTSAKNYRNAVNATTTQISNEQKAVNKYNKQANKVVNKAVSMGIVSKKQASSIKKQVKNGSINIKQYSDKVQEVIKDYQTWYEKSKTASKAIQELHNQIRTYIKDLKDMRDAQRDAKLDKINTYSSISENSHAYTADSQNSQLDYSNSQLNKQDKAYSSESSAVSKDTNKIGKSGTKAVKKALRTKDAKGKSKKSKAYKKALNNAKRAIKAKKAVSSADMKTIQSHSVSVYNKLYAYNLSLDNLEDAKLEYAVNYAATSEERFNNTASKYENLDNETNDKISLLQAKSKNATTAKIKNSELDKVASQYDKIVSDDKAEISDYQKQQSKSQNTINNKAGTGSKYKGLSKKSKSKVKSYINKAKNSANSGKSIDAGVISKLAEYYSKGYVSKTFYEACINYNNAVEHREEAEAQLAIDTETAKQEKAALGTERVNNVEQEYANKQDKTTSDKNKESIRQSIKSTKGFDLTVSDYQTMIGYSKQQEQIYTNEIASLNKTIQENINSGLWTTASQEYIDAMKSVNGYEEEVLNCQQEQEELNNSMIQLPYTVFDRAITLIQSLRSNLQSLLSIKSTKGIMKTESDILDEIGTINTEINELTEKRAQAWTDYQNALNNGGAYGGKTADEWLTEYKNIDTEVNNLTADIEELNNEKVQLPFDRIEKKLSLLDSIGSRIKSTNDLNKAYGKDLSEDDYLKEMDNNTKKIQKYTQERFLAYTNYQKALTNKEGVYGGKTADEWLTEYNSLGATIDGIKVDNEDIRKALRDDVYWRTFERAHQAAQRFQDVLSGLSDLINDDMLYDKDGNFTEFGIAQLGNLVKQYESAREEVQNYSNDIENLNKLYAEGQYTEEEYKDKLSELQNGLLNSASSMKSNISEVIDMYKNMAQAELDALFKLIDARNEALSAKKAYILMCVLC